MSKFSDRLGPTKPNKEDPDKWQEVSIGVWCTCGRDSEQVWYDKTSKKVKILCESGHEEILDMDLSWLMR